jgi:MFS family permease
MFSIHFPQYFTKKVRQEIGEIYAHSAIANTALSMMSLFEPIFLFAVLGFSINQVLLFTALIYIVYIVCLPIGGKFASLYGYKHSIAISIPFHILYWAVLIAAQHDPYLAFLAAPLYGLSKTFYWPGFHSLMARYADRDQVGREFGLVYSLISLTLIAGPLLAGFLSQRFGWTVTFIVTGFIYTLSLFPLFKYKEIFTPKIYFFKDTLQLYKTFPRKFLGYLGFGEEMIALNIWPIFIFIIVQNFEGTGALATVASLLAALLALIVGRITDQYSKHMLIKVGAFFGSLIWLARFAATTFWNTFFVDSLARTSKEVYFIPITTNFYIKSENTHIVPYVVFFEQSLAIGKLSACILGIVLFSLTGSFMVLFVLGALYSLLYMFI